jgi:uncharacterized protein (TIGR03382 family)
VNSSFELGVLKESTALPVGVARAGAALSRRRSNL